MKLWKKIGLGLGALVAAPFLAPVLAGLGGSALGAIGLGSVPGAVTAGAGVLVPGATAAGVGGGIGGATAGATTFAGAAKAAAAKVAASAVASAPKVAATAGIKAGGSKLFDTLGIGPRGQDAFQNLILPGLLGYAGGGLQGALTMPLMAARQRQLGQSSALPMLGGLAGRLLGGKSGGLSGMGAFGLLGGLLNSGPPAPNLGPTLTPEALMAGVKPAGPQFDPSVPPGLDSVFGKLG